MCQSIFLSKTSSKCVNLYFCRHGEKSDDTENKATGLTYQGGIRRHYMPQYVEKLLGKEAFDKNDYDLYTYTANKNHEATSRSYYTLGDLCDIINKNDKKKIHLIDESDDYDSFVKSIYDCKSNNAIICWEHNVINDLINKLLNINNAPEYNDLSKKYKQILRDILEKDASSAKEKKIKDKDIKGGDLQAKFAEKANDDLKKDRNTVRKALDDIEYGIVIKLKVVISNEKTITLSTDADAAIAFPSFVVDMDADIGMKNVVDGTYKIIDFSDNIKDDQSLITMLFNA